MPPPERESPIAILGWVARAKSLATRTSINEAEGWLIANRAPERAIRILKSPVGAGDLGDLGPYAIVDWAESMRATSAFYRIINDGGFTRLPIHTRCGIVTPVAATVVAEGAAKPLAPVQLSNVLLTPLKAAALMVVTDELLRNISSAGQTVLNRALIAAVSNAVDATFFDLVINTGTPAAPSSGITAAAAKSDLRTALRAVNTGSNSKFYWVCGVDAAKRASTLDAAGVDAFPAMSASGGEMANLPAIVSSGVPTNSLTLVDAVGIAADAGPVTVDTSNEADILMDGAAPMSSAVPTPAQMIPLWQTNSTALRCEAWFAVMPLRADAVASITGIAWGG